MPADPEMTSVVSFHSTPAPRSIGALLRGAPRRAARPRDTSRSPVWRPTSLSTKPMPASPVYRPGSVWRSIDASSSSAPAVAVARCAGSPVARCSSRKNSTTPALPL